MLRMRMSAMLRMILRMAVDHHGVVLSMTELLLPEDLFIVTSTWVSVSAHCTG
jgi:hypothetical protein